MRPINHMIVAAATTPSTLPGVANTSSSEPKNQAEPSPAITPMRSAVPPSRGVGFLWTPRSLGYAMASARRERSLNGGTDNAVAAAAMIITAM